MANIEIRQLVYFIAVHDHGGVTRAAESLHLSQPSLSAAVRSLERALKVELFHRVGRGLVLSPAGEVLLEPAREVLRSLSRAEQAVQGLRQLEEGRLTIAANAGLVPDPLSAWIGSFRREYPRMSVRIEESDDSSGVAELVRTGDCDLGVTASPEVHQGLEYQTVSEQFVVLTSPPGSPAGPGPITLDELADVPLIVDGQSSMAWAEIDRLFREAEIEPRIAVRVHRTASTSALVLAGAGSAFLPLRLALMAHQRGAVLRETQPRITRKLRLVSRSARLPEAARAFTSIVMADAARWVSALDRRFEEGMSLVQAGLAVDDTIRTAKVAAGLGG